MRETTLPASSCTVDNSHVTCMGDYIVNCMAMIGPMDPCNFMLMSLVEESVADGYSSYMTEELKVL